MRRIRRDIRDVIEAHGYSVDEKALNEIEEIVRPKKPREILDEVIRLMDQLKDAVPLTSAVLVVESQRKEDRGVRFTVQDAHHKRMAARLEAAAKELKRSK